MWTCKELREKGRAAFKANYRQCVLVCLIVLVLCTGFSTTPVGTGAGTLTVDGLRNLSPTQAVDEVARSVFGDNLAFWNAFSQVNKSTQGLLATLFNSAGAAGSMLFGALNAVNQFIFRGTVSAAAVLVLGAALLLFYWLFVNNIIRVGEARFYMENRSYPSSSLRRLFMVYRVRHTRHVALVMFLRALFNGLWFLTVAGGFIKRYSYRMVPFILAENPEASWRDTITESRRMMNGNKWRAFVLDLSFLGWRALGLATFGVLGVLYVTPYIAATNAELYMTLRETALAERPGSAAIFRDALLTPDGSVPCKRYPEEDCYIPEHKNRQWLAADYHRTYTLTDLVLLFFTFCFIGYVYEVLYFFIGSGILQNRGTLYGPWLPIYGVGGIAMLVVLKRLVNRPVALFFSSMALCGVIEYTTAWFLETFLHTKWWDYTGFFLNLQGRICLEGLLAFAAMGMIGIYVLAPSLAHLYDKIPKKARHGLCVGLSVAFLTDLTVSVFHPNMNAAVPMQTEK